MPKARSGWSGLLAVGCANFLCKASSMHYDGVEYHRRATAPHAGGWRHVAADAAGKGKIVVEATTQTRRG